MKKVKKLTKNFGIFPKESFIRIGKALVKYEKIMGEFKIDKNISTVIDIIDLFNDINLPSLYILKTSMAGEEVDNGQGVDFELPPYAVIHEGNIIDLNDESLKKLYGWQRENRINLLKLGTNNKKTNVDIEEMLERLGWDGYKIIWNKEMIKDIINEFNDARFAVWAILKVPDREDNELDNNEDLPMYVVFYDSIEDDNRENIIKEVVNQLNNKYKIEIVTLDNSKFFEYSVKDLVRSMCDCDDYQLVWKDYQG